MNLLDGIDGLASGVTGCIAISLAVINIASGNVVVALLTLSLAGASFGFLPHNFSPARIFLGDTGSLLMGYMLAGIGILSLFKATTLSFIAAPLLVFAVPLYDTLSVMLKRAFSGKPLFSADRSHLHHRLLALGWTQREAATFLCCISAFMGALGVFFSLQDQTEAPLLSLGLVLAGIGAVGLLSRRALAQRKTKPSTR